MPCQWDDCFHSFFWTFNHSQLFKVAESDEFCLPPPFPLSVLRAQGNDGDARQPKKSCMNSDPFIRQKTDHADDTISAFILKWKYLSFTVGWYKPPECCRYCGTTPQEGSSTTKEKVAAGVKMYIDIRCERALSSILSLLGQQTHQDPHRSSFSH